MKTNRYVAILFETDGDGRVMIVFKDRLTNALHSGGNNETGITYDASGSLLQSTDYYAFGLPFRTTNTDKNRYLYNGKEIENNTIGGTHLTTLDYGARHYDPIIARWFTTDPMAEKYYSLTPYNYCGNNPMNRIDPDGKEVRIAKEYQRQFINDLQNVFGDRTKMLSFNDNGTLQFES